MLKALELSGFKSFADKTRFVFPAGITAVVGPNGSGKSNIVDAIKWVLGEQSVKSLRGKEMADVIFNGSSSRRPMNAAEITLTFDNTHHLLAIDTAEVHITRRVYRSGEGEYLINRQPARLRDIRDLLSGTGLGSQAYSVIEQGKVDVLLQASARDRRIIFEEAAGISRFRSRKLEALRRLERVDQNLLRLSDIVDEVDSRLRGVRMQAGKARRYREHTSRLQELRTQVGLVDWRRLSDRLAEHEQALSELRTDRDAAAAEVESKEAGLIEIDDRVGQLTEEIRQVEARIAEDREQIATRESTIEHERRRLADLEGEAARYRRQMVALSHRTDDVRQQLAATEHDVRDAEHHHREVAQRVAEAERSLTDATRRLDHMRGQTEDRRSDYVTQMRSAAELGNEASALGSQTEAAETAREKAHGRLAELETQLRATEARIVALTQETEAAEEELDTARAALAAAESARDGSARRLARSREQMGELRQRRTVTAERIELLGELQARQEGVGAGVKDLLAAARSPNPGPLEHTHGMLADLLTVSIEVAPLVEVALGPLAQHIVASNRSALIEHLRQTAARLPGRVGFLWLQPEEGETRLGRSKLAGLPYGTESPHPSPLPEGKGTAGDTTLGLSHETESPHLSPLPEGEGTSADGEASVVKPPVAAEVPDLDGTSGVMGRVDRFVETDSKFRPLVKRLLSTTWIVEDLRHAVELAASHPGVSFVTVAGELLRADGTLVVGPRQESTGLISRRSQLRALREQLGQLDGQVDQVELQIATQQAELTTAENALIEHRRAEAQAADTLAERRFQRTAAGERREQLTGQRDALQQEAASAEQQHEHAAARLADVQRRQAELEASLQSLETQLAQLDEQIGRLEATRAQRERESTEIKVELAKSEERLRNFQSRLRHFEQGRKEHARTVEDNREQLARALDRAKASQWNILRAESEVAGLYLRKETLAREAVARIDQREGLRTERGELADLSGQARSRIRKLEESLHQRDLAASELRHQRNTLADRLREDYQIELAELEHEPTEQEQLQREAVQEEIDELRRKINNLGNVNVEALDELEQLESRYESLYTQHDDLTKAKNSLERIIEKINVDSRRLFVETLETVRGHFQTLFRDLFGGGQADIVLEQDVDILESGIEIVARPPGKEPRSISLLSGGEKTLTCVALLLAIFRSRPSPFCVLDEVDAALDEANIDRFIQVLRDFLALTQFIIVTHSKKTMTCATTLYGVTMQESGVSKQVSVSFEDVSEGGEISAEAIERGDLDEEDHQAA